MDEMTEVGHDIDRMCAYWIARKLDWRSKASEEFERLVCPQAFFELNPGRARLDAVNLCFTEWALFERPLRQGRTPLQLYVDHAPDGVDTATVARLRQVEQTQFFSRFAILSKDGESGMARLRDVRTDRVYEVLDPYLCANGRWRDGTIAERLACVEGVWQVVGRARLYDRATPEQTAHDGPGEAHPEDRGDPYLRDASYFVRLVRDVMGLGGRFAPSLAAYVEGRRVG